MTATRFQHFQRFGQCHIWAPALAMVLIGTQPATAQSAPPATGSEIMLPTSYADVAQFAVESATIVDARIRRSRVVERERVPGLPANMVRFYIEADVNTVIYGRDPVARRIAYLLDLPMAADGRAPRIRRDRVLLFARPVTNASQLQLVRTNAQLLWSAGHDLTARGIAMELARGDVPPAITGVAQAFHVTGTVAGESETQIFLSTDNGAPVSLTILRRPAQAPRWAVAFGEIVDESATVPARRTLGWFRLACGLPPTLPAAALTGASASEREAMVRDYAIVTSSVGSCDRTAGGGAALSVR